MDVETIVPKLASPGRKTRPFREPSFEKLGPYYRRAFDWPGRRRAGELLSRVGFDMEELKSLVARSQAGDVDAYGEIVRRFQDMAYGYAYSILGDFHLAEDAAQEAFIEAYRCLGNLREPAAFPGWFRRIVFKHCDRLTRRKEIPAIGLEAAASVASPDRQPSQRAEDREMKDKVLAAIRSLPEQQREVTTLFYINGYSQNDIAEFLEVPAGTVKSRLAASRNRLKERMINMVSDELKSHPLPDDFRTRTLKAAFLAQDVEGVLVGVLPQREDLLQMPPDRRPAGSEKLFEVVASNEDWVGFFQEAGFAEWEKLWDLIPDQKQLFETLLKLVEKHPDIALARAGRTGATLLHYVGTRFSDEIAGIHAQILEALISQGADVNARLARGANHPGTTPLHNAAGGGNTAAMKVLLDHGADVDARTDAGDTPLIVAVWFGQIEAIEMLLDQGAKIDLKSNNGYTALHTTAWCGQVEAVKLLLTRGADADATNDSGQTPLLISKERGNKEVSALLREAQAKG
ncbi:MAG: sigma-70 family RNA polymerase sigma factor [Phycisphaerae bacterium]|nr:sigma-70 family RNA polymerase sigma factor [Phycisphaerae bacterium]